MAGTAARIAVGAALLWWLAAHPASGQGKERIWLEVDAPAEGRVSASLGLIEVRGRAGVRGFRGYDVVIAIDLSDSTLAPSGVDIDRDGPEARTDPGFLNWLTSQGERGVGLTQRLGEVDFDDSVLMAELAAADALLERLDPRHFRIGLVAFSDEAQVVARVGSSRQQLLASLWELRRGFLEELRGTNFAAAVQVAHGALDAAPMPLDQPRDRSILLLSDGSPTLPVPPERARRRAVEAAFTAAASGIRIFAYALGHRAIEALDIYREMAGLTDGRIEKLERPGDAVARLRRIDLAGLAEVRIENLTTHRTARATRIFPDGSFDGFVEIASGENRLRITVRALDESEATLERRVIFTRAADEEADQARMKALLEELRRRTRETELWAEIESGRHVKRGELELEAEKQLEAEEQRGTNSD